MTFLLLISSRLNNVLLKHSNILLHALCLQQACILLTAAYPRHSVCSEQDNNYSDILLPGNRSCLGDFGGTVD